MGSSRSVARQLAYQKFKDSNANSVHWPWLDYGSVYTGLLARIDNPDLIWQSTSNLCGTASALSALATDDPWLYAFYVCELYHSGAAYLGYGNEAPLVRPAKATRNWKPPQGVHQTDWLALAALRDHLNERLDYTFDMGVPLGRELPLLAVPSTPRLIERLAALNYPSEVVTLLKAIGYTRVVNAAAWSVPANAVRVSEASGYHAAGYRVLLLVNAGMFDAASDGRTGPPAGTNRWVRLMDRFELTTRQFGEEHGIRLVIRDPQSSGAPPSASLLPADGGYLRVSSFLHHFYGFVAARP